MYIPKKQRAVFVPPHVLQAKGNLMWSVAALGSFAGICILGVYNYLNNRSREAAIARRANGPRVIVIGGNCAGSTAAAAITQHHPDVQVTVFEPAREHCFFGLVPLAAVGHRSYDLRCNGPNTLYSTPAWTVTRDAELVSHAVKSINPHHNKVVDDFGVEHQYDVLILACGARFDFDAIKGLKKEDYDKHGVVYTPGMIRDGICTTHQGNVIVARVPYTKYTRPHDGTYIGVANTLWKFLQYFGRLASCATVQLHVVTPDGSPSSFFSARHNEAILSCWNERCINFLPKTRLTEVNPKKRIATFFDVNKNQSIQVPYRLLVLDLPRRAPDLIANSGLSAPGLDGFADVDQETLQHHSFPNIFAIGDCAALPIVKSYGAIYAQAPVLAHNVTQYLSHRKPNATYSGYSSFAVQMTTWRAMWPETFGSEYLARSSNAEDFIRNHSGHLWDDSDWRYWKGFLQGFYIQSTAYEFMHWLIFTRAMFCSPNWFSAPEFPDGEVAGQT